jgi:hypothetical protein
MVTLLEIGLWGSGGGGLTNGEDYRYHTTMDIYTQENNSKIFLLSYGHVVEAQCHYRTLPTQPSKLAKLDFLIAWADSKNLRCLKIFLHFQAQIFLMK